MRVPVWHAGFFVFQIGTLTFLSIETVVKGGNRLAQFPKPSRLIISLLIAGLLLSCISFFGNLIENGIFQARFANAETTVSQLAVRLPKARQTYQDNWQLYADHWQGGVKDQLQQATGYFDPSKQFPQGHVQYLLAQARRYVKQDHGKTSSFLDQLDIFVKPSNDVVNKILGPPDKSVQGLYDQLKGEASQANTAIQDGRNEISSSQYSLRQRETDSWNVAHIVTFSDAEGTLSQSRAQLQTAQQILVTRIERGLIDKPKAYAEAQFAIRTAKMAVTQADDRERSARSAQTAIDNAQVEINIDSSSISSASYNHSRALFDLQVARSTLGSARLSFSRGDYSYSQSLANTAQTQARNAKSETTPPPPPPQTSSNNSSSSSVSSNSSSSSGSGNSNKPSWSTGSGSSNRSPWSGGSGSSNKPSWSTGSGSSNKPSWSSGSGSSNRSSWGSKH